MPNTDIISGNMRGTSKGEIPSPMVRQSAVRAPIAVCACLALLMLSGCGDIGKIEKNGPIGRTLEKANSVLKVAQNYLGQKLEQTPLSFPLPFPKYSKSVDLSFLTELPPVNSELEPMVQGLTSFALRKNILVIPRRVDADLKAPYDIFGGIQSLVPSERRGLFSQLVAAYRKNEVLRERMDTSVNGLEGAYLEPYWLPGTAELGEGANRPGAAVSVIVSRTDVTGPPQVYRVFTHELLHWRLNEALDRQLSHSENSNILRFIEAKLRDSEGANSSIRVRWIAPNNGQSGYFQVGDTKISAYSAVSRITNKVAEEMWPSGEDRNTLLLSWVSTAELTKLRDYGNILIFSLYLKPFNELELLRIQVDSDYLGLPNSSKEGILGEIDQLLDPDSPRCDCYEGNPWQLGWLNLISKELKQRNQTEGVFSSLINRIEAANGQLAAYRSWLSALKEESTKNNQDGASPDGFGGKKNITKFIIGGVVALLLIKAFSR